MKKKVLKMALLLATGSISAAQAKVYFNGFYTGAFTGYTQRSVDNKSIFNGNLTLRNTSGHSFNIKNLEYGKSKTTKGIIYGLMGGYGKSFNGFYLGGEISLHHDTLSKNENCNVTSIAINGTSYPATGQMKYKVKYNRGPALGLALRIGGIVSGSYLLYIKPGLEISRDKLEWHSEDDSFSSKRKTKVTFSPSVGVEKYFDNNFLLRLEYTYNLGSKLSKSETGSDTGVFNNITGTGSGTVTKTAKYTSHAVKVGLAYQF